MDKKKFKLPVTWEVCGFVDVEATSVEEAIKIFDETKDGIPLPKDGEYVDASFDLSDREADYIMLYN